MIRIVRLGAPRSPGEGPRFGTVRRPPRGVPKKDFARLDYYDVWLPELSPTEPLVRAALAAKTGAEWQRFVKRFRAEMAKPPAARILDALAVLSRTSSFSLGCYCEDETRCHRSVLRALLTERGAAVK